MLRTGSSKKIRRPRIRYQRTPMRLPTEKMIEAFLDAYTGSDEWRSYAQKTKDALIDKVTQPLRAAMYVYLENND